jgi:protein gp37
LLLFAKKIAITIITAYLNSETEAQMAENTNIEWATHTFNPWMGCQKVGPGCDHCYAEVWDEKAGGESRWGPHAARTRSKQGNWDRVVTWNSKARDAGIRESVFVASLADVFDTHSSILPEWRADLAALVKKCENLDFMFLTKRAGNVEKLLKAMFPEGAPSNLWIGANRPVASQSPSCRWSRCWAP